MADETFDPYHKWLGIPPEEQPPNHYQLLAIKHYESDPEVISNAADQRMTYIRTLQTGEHDILAGRILNEIAMARVCLLNRDRKATYDRQLRDQARMKGGASARRREKVRQVEATPPGRAATDKTAGPQEPSRWSHPVLAAATGFLCPHCQQGIGYDPMLPGKTVSCPSCGELFTIPSTPRQIPQSAMRSASSRAGEDTTDAQHRPIIPGHYLLSGHSDKDGSGGTAVALVFRSLMVLTTIAWVASMPINGLRAYREDYQRLTATEVNPGSFQVHGEIVPESKVRQCAITTGIVAGALLPTVIYAVAMIVLSSLRFAVEGSIGRRAPRQGAGRGEHRHE